jgi:chemotaxis protein MotB
MSHGGGDGGGERWLVSYADFITLLMVLFVVLYSMGQVDVEKYKRLAESMRAVFSGGAAKLIDPGLNQGGSTGDPAPIVIPGIPRQSFDEVEVAGQLTDMLASANLGGAVSVQNNIEGVLISLSEKLLFIPGTAELQAEAYPVLDVIAEMLRPLDNDIRVIGHTDDQPPTDPRYLTNWELSTARAVNVVNYLIGKGIAPQRMTAVGRGEYQPVFANDTSEHRALNSRADIVVIYEVKTDVISLPETNPISNGELTTAEGEPAQP